MWLLSFGPLTSPHLLFLIEREEDKERERRAAQPTDRHTEREKEREREREGPPYPSISTSHSFLSCSTPKAIPYLFLSLLSHCLLSHSPCPSKHTHETRRDETRRDKWANESRHCILWTNAICFCVCKAKLSHPIRSILFPARRNPKHTSSAPHHYHYHYGPTFTSIGFWVLSFGFWVLGFGFRIHPFSREHPIPPTPALPYRHACTHTHTLVNHIHFLGHTFYTTKLRKEKVRRWGRGGWWGNILIHTRFFEHLLHHTTK